MSQPTAAAAASTAPMCMAGLLGKGTADRTTAAAALTAGFQPNVASTSDLTGYGSSLFANVTLSAAARAAAGLEVEGEGCVCVIRSFRPAALIFPLLRGNDFGLFARLNLRIKQPPEEMVANASVYEWRPHSSCCKAPKKYLPINENASLKSQFHFTYLCMRMHHTNSVFLSRL